MFSKTLSSLLVLLAASAAVTAIPCGICAHQDPSGIESNHSKVPTATGSSALPSQSAAGSSNSTDKRDSSSAAPHFVIYSDNYVSGTLPSLDKVKVRSHRYFARCRIVFTKSPFF